MLRALLLATFLCAVYCLHAQDDYLHDFRITSENDNYMLTFRDGYYTNGVFLNYSHPSKWRRGDKIAKIISGYKAGQMVFSSESFRNNRLDKIDRPPSGYLFVERSASFFYKKGHILNAAVAIGATGSSSLAHEVQAWYHEAMNLPRVRGWDYQLNGEVTVNFSADYYYNILGVKNKRSNFELMGTGSLSLGNAFTNASAGAMVKFGNFEDPFHSAFYNARTGRGTGAALKRKAEIFVYYWPQLTYQFYNATVQGPLFEKEKGPIVSDIEPVVFIQHWGMFYSESRWTASFQITRKQREATSMRRNKEKFASLTLGYRFGRLKRLG
jgi:lipid A 3-O-deacylase